MDRSMRDHLLSIGEMAEANHVSIATLRLYDRMGLLKPSYRDAESNYRYYDIRQTSRLDIIRYLQNLGMSLAEIQAQDVPAELHALSHWCWHTCSSDSLAVAMAATNYAIEGVTGEWSALVCSNGVYENAFPKEGRKRAMKWLKLHAQYDDAHPWEALEIICTLAGTNPGAELRRQLRDAICKSYDYMYLFLERCMQLEEARSARKLAVGAE